jgi:hypothetical protein
LSGKKGEGGTMMSHGGIGKKEIKKLLPRMAESVSRFVPQFSWRNFLLGMLYMRVLFLFTFAYSEQPVVFESFFPTSPLTQVLALCMQTYGSLLAMRYTCSYEGADAAVLSKSDVSKKLLCIETILEKVFAEELVKNLEDIEFLVGVLEKMEHVCQLLQLCAPADEELRNIEQKIVLVQKKIELFLAQS